MNEDWSKIAAESILTNTHGAAPEEIADAEERLGLSFAADYREFLAAVGACMMNGHEIVGLCPFADLCVVNVTMTERERNKNIPPNWYMLEQAHIDDITVWQDETGAVYQLVPNAGPNRPADGLMDYLTKC